MTDATVAALASLVGGRLVGDGARVIAGLGDLRTAGPDRIGFVRDASYNALAATTRAGALLSARELQTAASQIVVADVDVAFAKVATHFHPTPRAVEHLVHGTAVVDPGAEIEAPVSIGPRAVVGRCRIGSGSVLMPGVTVGDGARIGRDCVLYPNVVVYPGSQLGDRVILQAGAVVGSDGFGYARDGATWIKVPQLGVVILEDDVELGVGTAVDRGTLGSTRIGARTKLDNLCHIAHNCVVGSDVVMAAGCMIAGSTTVGDRCVLAGSVGVSGHLKIAADVRLGGGSVVLRDVPKAGDFMGHPLLEKRQSFRLLRILRGLVDRSRDALDEGGTD